MKAFKRIFNFARNKNERNNEKIYDTNHFFNKSLIYCPDLSVKRYIADQRFFNAWVTIAVRIVERNVARARCAVSMGVAPS
jgi:hypothetical protein